MSYERKNKVTNTWWIKIWVKDVLTGSLMTRGSIEDLGFMVAMACLAADCRGEYGWIQANPETPFTHQYLANRLNMKLKHFKTLLQRQIVEERMAESGKGIFVCNMEYYQKMKGAKEPGGNGSKPDKMPLTVEEKIQRQKQLAADMAYKYPDEAEVGIDRKMSECRHKNGH